MSNEQPGWTPYAEAAGGALWHVLVEASAGYAEVVDGSWASKDEALEQARLRAFAHRPPIGFRKERRRVFRDGDGYVVTFGSSETALAVGVRVVRLEPGLD